VLNDNIFNGSGDHIQNWFIFEVIGGNGTLFAISEAKTLIKNSE